MITVLENRRAFNIIANDSLLVFQFTDNLVPCAAQITYTKSSVQEDNRDHAGKNGSLSESILQAYNKIVGEYPPDNKNMALILDNVSCPVAEQAASILITEGYCKSVYIVPDEDSFLELYPFLTKIGTSQIPVYASEITDTLYLGGISSVDERALSDLGVTAVLSMVQHPLSQVPACITHHRRCSVEDEQNARIDQFFEDAIEFIGAAHSRGQKVLVHCHQGVSRSVSVLIAYMVHAKMCESVVHALATIREQRPHARPNPAFMAQLLAWEDSRKNQNEKYVRKLDVT